MATQILPHKNASATLFSRSDKGVIVPIVMDNLGNCAWLLKKMWPPKAGWDLWVECSGQRLDTALVDADFQLEQYAEPE
ncbi:hypothetical protein [Novosphingobium rosa]|jgi:hypothetical protein|uniref:hypothetical protein n=1 Tax=Novosphingobium rosa TaxID=76978 RepID=UPI0008300770|nr:hypothetical protein [Novosphingobium rosa]